MLRRASFAVAVIALTGGFVFSGQAPNQTRNRVDGYNIRGRIILPNSQTVDQRIEVQLEKAELQVIQTAYADAAGNFGFSNLLAGNYYISVSIEGYEPVRQAVEVTNSFSHATVTIFVSKPVITVREKPEGLDADEPDVVDVSQMKESLPKKAVQAYEKASDERQKGHTESAIKLLEEAIKLAPNFVRAHNNLGILYQSVQRYDDAEKEFRRSHELNAKTERPLLNLGSLYIEEANLQKSDNDAAGKFLDQALDVLEESVKVNPRSGTAYFLLGQANYRSSFLEEAEAAFKKAQELDPKLIASRLMLANIYVKEEKWQNVLESLDAYLKENPKSPERANVEQTRESILKVIEASNSPK